MIGWTFLEGIGAYCIAASLRLRFVAFVLLALVLLVGAMLLEPSVALAQGSEVQRSPELLQGGGRELGVRDWISHLPLALGVVLVVVAVDAFVIFKFVRGRQESQ